MLQTNRTTDLPIRHATSVVPASNPAPLPPTWRSEELLAGKPEAHIEHGGSVYRLRLTMLGKLILTK